MTAKRLLVAVVLLPSACIGHRPAPLQAPSPAPGPQASPAKALTGRRATRRDGSRPAAGAAGENAAQQSGAERLVPCTEHHGNVLVCAGEQIEGLTVTAAGDGDGDGDGTFHRIAWRRHYGSDRRWRSTALYDTGLISFIVDPGADNARRWWTLSRWGFPRTQRITVARVPGTLRFEVTDFGGTVWTLVGTPRTPHHVSFAVEAIGGQPQTAREPARTDDGIVGIDLGRTHPLLLEQRVASYSPYADLKAPAYLGKKSRFRDRHGTTCAVANRRLFGDRPGGGPRPSPFLFDTDAELVAFLSSHCPALDLEPLRTQRPPSPAPVRN